MQKGRIKYYLFLIISMIGAGYFAVSYAVEGLSEAASGLTSPASAPKSKSDQTTTEDPAYQKLTEAQTNADTYNELADKTREEKPDDYLNLIAKNTYAFLKAFNYFSLNWLQIYTVPTSTELDTLFVNYGLSSAYNLSYQLGQLKSIYLFDYKERNIYPYKALPSPEMDYATLLTLDETSPDKEKLNKQKLDAQAFIKNVSGINIFHPGLVSNDMEGEPYKKYITFINSIKSVSNYNAYILNTQFADLKNNMALSQTQTELKKKASGNDWVNHINTEVSLGVILRQLLLFNSQMYVIMADLLITQKQLLATTAMTNTLLVAISGDYEKTLLNAAAK